MRVLILTLAFSGAIAGLAGPVFQKIFVDRLMGATSLEGDRLNLPWLQTLSPLDAIGIAFVTTLISQALGLIGNFLCIREGAILQRIFSEALYRKMLSIRPDSMGTTTVGEVVSIYATDVAGGTALIDQVLPMAAIIVFNLALAPLAVRWICGIPLGMTLLVMAAIILMIVVMSTRQSRYFARFKQLAAERTGIVNEWVQTIRLLRILGWVESFERKIFAKREEETANRVAMVTNGQLMNAFGSSINFIVNLTGVATLIYMSGRKVTPGELFAMLWIFGVFMARSFRQIPWFFTFTFDSVTSLRRVQRFLARKSDAGPVEVTQSEEDVKSTPLGLSVRGLNLVIGGAGGAGGAQPILHDIDFDVRPGEFVAVVGEVGSGKSMLILSLLGETGAVFREFKIGDKIGNEIDARHLDVNRRRGYFAFVPQEGFVMSATLRENIAFRYDANRAFDMDIRKSLEVAQFRLEEEIQGPGLDTEIGERGVNMSGGQRQRISLARAHHFRRPIIVLDDCLSAVDVDTEKNLVRDLLDGEWRGQTRLLVTHRLSVLHRVDRILFMENGRIIDSGKFEDLLKRSVKMQEFVASVLRSEGERKGADGEIEPLP